jgi:benzoyl-CoA-dihydrodiol lyase
MRIDFQTEPSRYRHWRLEFHGRIAHLIMDVDPTGSLFPGCELKLNSYDLGVDIELADAIQRLRFEHPEVGCVVLRSGKPNVFCAGANIRMLAMASHQHKVNFCKFTNETRLAMEEASVESGQTYLCAANGSAAGGGYELALAASHIMLVDDRRSTVALPEAPLLAVLPGTGGLTRLTDKRKVRRDRSDVFCTTEEGVRGPRALEWHLVDEIVPPSRWEVALAERAAALAARSDRPAAGQGITLAMLEHRIEPDRLSYTHLEVTIQRNARRATLMLRGPEHMPAGLTELHRAGAAFWPLAAARELDDALLHLRFNEPTIGLLLLCTEGDLQAAMRVDLLLQTYRQDWLVREILLLWRRVLKRLDVTSRSLIALIEPGSCFAGTLAELAFAADRTIMFAGGSATLQLSPLNFGAYPMGNGLTRLQTRFIGEPESLEAAEGQIGQTLGSDEAERLGLITAGIEDLDWDDELRVMLEERASLSPDALTAMEANLRFAGPETMETRIFGRLTAWQNWVFQRPNAVGEQGALKRYGSGVKPEYNPERV